MYKLYYLDQRVLKREGARPSPLSTPSPTSSNDYYCQTLQTLGPPLWRFGCVQKETWRRRADCILSVCKNLVVAQPLLGAKGRKPTINLQPRTVNLIIP